jgi:hypothetical protein
LPSKEWPSQKERENQINGFQKSGEKEDSKQPFLVRLEIPLLKLCFEQINGFQKSGEKEDSKQPFLDRLEIPLS